MIKTLSLALAMAVAPLALPAKVSTWTLDQSHSEIGFEVTHLGIAKVRGRFTEGNATIKLDAKDITKSKVQITIPVKSVSTGNAKRDGHLLDGDFFEAAKHPNIEFKSTKISKTSDGYLLEGKLSIRGVTKDVALKAQLGEPLATDWGFNKRAFSLRGSINRFDYGVAWSKKTKAESLVVGETVELVIDGEIDEKN